MSQLQLTSYLENARFRITTVISWPYEYCYTLIYSLSTTKRWEPFSLQSLAITSWTQNDYNGDHILKYVLLGHIKRITLRITDNHLNYKSDKHFRYWQLYNHCCNILCLNREKLNCTISVFKCAFLHFISTSFSLFVCFRLTLVLVLICAKNNMIYNFKWKVPSTTSTELMKYFI